MPDRKYGKAPIQEAIINIQVSVNDPCSLQDIEKYGKSIEESYSKLEKIWESNTVVSLTPDNIIKNETTYEEVGCRVETETDSKRVLQLRPDSFTLSWMHPYNGWDEFQKEAKSLWEGYWNVIKPTSIQRLAVRYINKIDIESTSNEPIEIGKYFTLYPQIPNVVALKFCTIKHSVLQVIIPQTDINGSLVINQAVVPPPKDNCLSILLDIDVFSEQGWNTNQASAWEFIGLLRERKNDAFESFITDETRRLFK